MGKPDCDSDLPTDLDNGSQASFSHMGARFSHLGRAPKKTRGHVILNLRRRSRQSKPRMRKVSQNSKVEGAAHAH